MRISAEVPRVGASKDSEVVDDGNFWRFTSYFFVNFRDKASSVIWRCASPCWPVIDWRMNDLE